MLALLGCVPEPLVAEPPACDPRELAPDEVRAKPYACGDEGIDDGEGRVGDWILESAAGRFVVRGSYAALTELEELGGTLVDAAVPGGEDLLMEYRPDGDRSSIEPVQGDGWAELRLPGLTWHLDAGSDALLVSVPTGRLLPLPGVSRTGLTLREGDDFLGLDGAGEGDGAVTVHGLTRIALSEAGTWPEGVEQGGEVDADGVVAYVGDEPLVYLPVTDGAFGAVLPEGASFTGVRSGCDYDGLVQIGCGQLHLRVRDEAGLGLDAILTDGSAHWPAPHGGGILEVGPTPRNLWVWAGPAWSAALVSVPGDAQVTLRREMDTDGAVLAALGETVAPDADTTRTPKHAAHDRVREGVGFVIALADDEVPTASVDDHDAVWERAGSRAAGWLWSWPWSPSSKRPAHGAVRWKDLSALDQLTVSEGGAGTGRFTVVTPEWVEAALAEGAPATWDPSPDMLWLDSLDEVDTFVGLLDRWVDITPVASRTWVETDTAINRVAVEAGLVDGTVTAGTGPRLRLSRREGFEGRFVDVRLDAATWTGMHTVTLWTSRGPVVRDASALTSFDLPIGTTWMFATARGDRARPWGDGEAWAVSGVRWLEGP